MLRDPTRLSWRARWLGAWCALVTAVTGRHAYLSTGCLHGDHGYCAGMIGAAGRKRPASCKKCVAGACRCRCHRGGNGTFMGRPGIVRPVPAAAPRPVP